MADAAVKEIIADCIQARVHGNQACTHYARSDPGQKGQREAMQLEAQRIAELIKSFPDTWEFKPQLVAVCIMMSDVYHKGRNAGEERDGTSENFWRFMNGLSAQLGKTIAQPQFVHADGNYPKSYGGLNAVFHGQRSLADYMSHVATAHGPDAKMLASIFLPDAAAAAGIAGAAGGA